MQIDNLTIDQNTYTSEFINQAKSELGKLLAEVKEEYRPTVEKLGQEMIDAYKVISDLPPGEEQARLQENLQHIKAALTHFEATIEIKLYDRIIKICEIAADIAIKAAISSLIIL